MQRQPTLQFTVAQNQYSQILILRPSTSYPKEFKKYFGVLAIDEVHVCGAEKFSRVVTLFPAKYRIGASATMDRADGMSGVYKMHVGQMLLKMEGGTDEKQKDQ